MERERITQRDMGETRKGSGVRRREGGSRSRGGEKERYERNYFGVLSVTQWISMWYICKVSYSKYPWCILHVLRVNANHFCKDHLWTKLLYSQKLGIRWGLGLPFLV